MHVPLRTILGKLYPGRFALGKRKKKKKRPPWKRWMKILTIALLVFKVALFLFYYNTFLSLQYDVEEAAAQIDTQLQRRKNIILNVGIMVTDYANHEREIFKHTADTRKEMVEARAGPRPEGKEAGIPRVEKPGTKMVKALENLLDKILNRGKGLHAGQAVGELDALLSKIFAVAERYPDLKLSENYRQFLEALVDAENKIADQRMIYNERANRMSTAVGTFPGFIMAKIFGFEPPTFYEPEREAKKPPMVG
ncbi:MAG: LemA family protein [Planctomycetota bacterium]|jgi:LemA protein